jgi:collagen type III alpha
MSSTATSSGNSSRYLDFDEYVDLKLQKTRSTIKTTDILVALAGVAAMFLGYLLVFVIFDQWVVPGGFSIGLRWLLLSTLLLLTGAWLGWKVGRPYLRSVNRLFAANEIEKADADLKSNLLNLIDLRASGREVDPSILRALEKNAAVGLQKIDVAQAIDHRPLMRIAYVLLAVVVLFCLYALFSPKKISNSIWRSLLPAAKLAVATQTEIVKVEPGDCTLEARKSVLFEADIAGDVPDKVWVHYSTADGKFQDEPIELRADSDAPTRFKGTLPSVVQNLSYIVRAGDAVSHRYHITVTQPPSATVDRIRFQFPAYMKLEEAEFAGGQIDAWDGTTVSVTAHTNMPVKSAKIQFLDTAETGPTPDDVAVLVSRDGQQLTASWKLGFRSDGTYSRLYQIHCTTESGATDPVPIRYAITIRPDLAPEVSILEPVRDMDVPANAILPLLVEARDPDFQLSQVNLHVKKNGQQVQKESLLSTPQQRLLAKHDLKLDRLQVKPGDTVELWVQAFDNRQPRPNSKLTPELKLKIVDPLSEKDAQQKLADDQANRDQRLKDAEQEQNQEGRPDQKAGAGEASDKRTRDSKDPERRDPQPRQKDPTAKDEPSPKENTSPDPTGDSGKTKNTPGGQDNKPNGAGQQKSDKNQSGTPENKSPQETPLNSDGEDDDKALEKLINSLKKPKEEQANQTKDKQGDGNPNDQKTEPKSETPNAGSEGTTQPNQEPTQPEAKPDQTGTNNKTSKPSSDKTQQTNPKKPSEQDQPKPNPASPPQPKVNQDSSSGGEPKQPMPGNQGTKKPENSGTKPNETPQPNANKPDKSGKTNEKQDNSKEKGPMDQGAGAKPKADPNQNKDDGAGPGEAPKPDKMNDGGEEGKDPKSNPKPGGEGNDPAGAEKPEPGAGPMDGTDGPLEKGDTAKPANPAQNPQAGGEPGKPKPATGAGTGEEKEGPSGEGPEEQTSPSPNAQKKTADGTETGKATPDRDPGAKPTNSDNPDLKRDPNEKPATQSREATTQESNDPAQQAADNKVKTPKPQSGGVEKQKIEQTGDSEKTPPGQKPQKQQGDPNAANEPQQGSKQKDPRSKQGDGGQRGSSKVDQAGDPGSKDPGQGDAADRPGTQQPTKENSKEAGGENMPGAGKDATAGGEKKPGPKKNQEGASKDGSGQKNDPNASGKSEGKGAGKDGAGKDGAEGGQPGEGPTGGQPGGTAEGSSPSGAASPPGTGRNTGSSGEGRPGKRGNVAAEGRPDGNNEPAEANSSGSTPEGEEANLEYKKQATELVLKRLQDELERGDVDPELLEKLGWTKDELRRFSDRLNKALAESKSGDETPESLSRRQQFEEMLKGLDVNKSGTKRSGENSPQREVNQIESRHSTVPKAYRAASEKLSREVSRQKKATSK